MADEYRAKGAQLAAEAKRERDPVRRAQLQSLERSYRRLAIQADKNAMTNIVYETPERPAVAQQQQQQQIPAKKKPQP
ncbi:MAG TPA: hypothetical protein VJL90_09540 [Pseudorhodoplanes sp.]|nr:hypothetical protein [Pseudorhodoplanes sp.]